MILHTPRTRPKPWSVTKRHAASRWLIPLFAFEYVSDWVAYFLSNWSFLEVLEYLGTFSVLIGVIFYFSESGDRVKQRHYQAGRSSTRLRVKAATAEGSKRSRN